MKNKPIIIFFLLFIHVAFWFILKPAPPFSDDKVYALTAQTMVEGHYHLSESPKNHRLTVIAPTALFIKLFGESPFVVSLWTLLCSLITILILFLFLSEYSSVEIAFTASFLLACNNLQVIYSAALFPDVIVSLFAFLVIELIYRSRIENSSKLKTIIGATVYFYIGFLAKEIIIIILPFILFLFISDWIKKVNRTFWIKFFISLISGGVILNAIYFFSKDDVNFIYHCINKNHNEVFAIFSNDELLKRYTYQPLAYLFQNAGYSVLILFLFSFIVYKVRFTNPDETQESLIPDRNFVPVRNPLIKFFTTYFLILLATYWWMPTSFNHLSPILLIGFERMWMLLLIPLVIIAAHLIAKSVHEEGSRKGLLIISIIFTLTANAYVSLGANNRAAMFLLFSFSAITGIILKERTGMNKQLILCIVLSPAFLIALYLAWQNSGWR